MPNAFFASDDFAYRVHYEGRAGRMNSLGFYPDMQFDIYTVSVGKDRNGDDWHEVPLQFIPSNCMAWIEEQVAEHLSEKEGDTGDRDYDSEPGGVDHTYSPD